MWKGFNSSNTYKRASGFLMDAGKVYNETFILVLFKGGQVELFFAALFENISMKYPFTPLL